MVPASIPPLVAMSMSLEIRWADPAAHRRRQSAVPPANA